MKIDKYLLKIFYTGLLLTVGTVVITLTVNLINEHDDLLSSLGLISSLSAVLLMVWGTYKIWLSTKTKKKKNEQQTG